MMCLTDWQVVKQGNPSHMEIHRKRNLATDNSVEKDAKVRMTEACSRIRREAVVVERTC